MRLTGARATLLARYAGSIQPRRWWSHLSQPALLRHPWEGTDSCGSLQSSASPAGHSLIELLVVIAIIAIRRDPLSGVYPSAREPQGDPSNLRQSAWDDDVCPGLRCRPCPCYMGLDYSVRWYYRSLTPACSFHYEELQVFAPSGCCGAIREILLSNGQGPPLPVARSLHRRGYGDSYRADVTLG